MIAKLVIVVLILAILVALFSGLVFLVKGPGKHHDRRTLHALTWRIGLQVLLILFLVVAFFMGWIKPHGLTP